MNNVNVLQIASVALKLAPKVNLKKMLMENAAVVVAHAVRMNVNVHLNVFAKKNKCTSEKPTETESKCCKC